MKRIIPLTLILAIIISVFAPFSASAEEYEVRTISQTVLPP